MYGFNSFQSMQTPQQYNSYPSQDERIWVQNEIADESYLVAPGGFVRLWDSSKPVFYEKKADINGRPLPMEAFEYKRREAQIKPVIPEGDNLIVREIEGIETRLSALEKGAVNVSEPDADDTAV